MRRKSAGRGRTSAGRFPSGTPTSATTSASETAVEMSAESEDESKTQTTDAEKETECLPVAESGDQSPLKLSVTASQSEESLTVTETADPTGKTSADTGELDVSAESQDMVLAESDAEQESGLMGTDDILLIDSDDGNDQDGVQKTGKVSADGAKPAGYVAIPNQVPAKDDDDMVEFMKVLGLKGATGFLELSIGGAPPIHVVAAETRPFRALRRVVVRDTRPSDLAHSILLELTASEMCNHVRLECDRLKHDVNSWTGELEMYFGTAATAISATETLRGLRDGVAIDYGNIPIVEKPSSPEQSKLLEYEMRYVCCLADVNIAEPWSDLIVIIKNIGMTTDETKTKLSELFPDADVVFHKDGTSEVIKGQAYLLFASKELADNAIQTFRRKQFRLDGKRLILIRWDPLRLLPDGMLRVGERRLLMLTMLQMETRLAKGGAPLLTAKYKALGEIVARDTKTRRACGFPAPSYNQLKGLYDVRNYSDAETALILRRLLTPYGCAGPDETTVENPPTKPATKPQPAAVASPATKPATPAAGVSKPATTPGGSSKPVTPVGSGGKQLTPATPVGKPVTAHGGPGKPLTPAGRGAKPAGGAGAPAGRNVPVKPTTPAAKTLPVKPAEKVGTGSEKGKIPDGKETKGSFVKEQSGKASKDAEQKPETSERKTGKESLAGAGKTEPFKKNSQEPKKSFGAGRDNKPSPSGASERPGRGGGTRNPATGGRGGRGSNQKITSLLNLNVSKPGPNPGPGLLGMFPSNVIGGSAMQQQQRGGLLSTPLNLLPPPPQPAAILPMQVPQLAASLMQRPLSPRRSPPMKRGNRDGLLGSYPGDSDPSPTRYASSSNVPSLLSDLNEPRPKLMRYDDERDSRRSRFDAGESDRYGRRDGSPSRSAARDQRSDGYERGTAGANPGVVSIFDLGERHSRGAGSDREPAETQYIKPLLADWSAEDRRDGRSAGTTGQRDESYQSGARYQEGGRGREFEADRGFVVSEYRHAGERSWQDNREERPSTDSRYTAGQYDRGEVRPLIEQRDSRDNRGQVRPLLEPDRREGRENLSGSRGEVRPLLEQRDDRRSDSRPGNFGGSSRSGGNSGYDDRRAMTSGNSSAIPSIFDMQAKFDNRGNSSGSFAQRSDGSGIPATSSGGRYDDYRGGNTSRSGDIGAVGVSGMASAYASGMGGSSAAYASGGGEDMSASYGMGGGGNMTGYGASSAGVTSLMDYGGAAGRAGDWATPSAGGSGNTRYDPSEPTGSTGMKRLTPQGGAQSDAQTQPDPVTLLMNLSQLLADKLQRDKDKSQHRDF